MRFFFQLLFFPFIVFSQVIDFSLEQTWSIYDVQDIYTFSFLPDYVGDINYPVEAYKISYLTPNEDGDSVIASGVIFIPVESTCPLPILSWQHGTIVSDSAAPSEKIDDNIIGVVSASHGYVVVMSDYLGLGSGEGFHNYCHSSTEASAVIDLIINSKDLISSFGLELNNQLFLMGYSQGGHATMATVKDIEANWSDELVITASSPMAGPYSMSEAQTATLVSEGYPNPGYFPYVIFSYQNVYDNIYENKSDIFKDGFENLLDMYDGTYSMSEINNEIWSIANDLYNIPSSEFMPLDMFDLDYFFNFSQDENHPFRLALEANDLLNFTPQSPMSIIHCNGDDNVPYENALMAYENFESLAQEELILLDGGNFNHNECASSSIISGKLFFDTYAQFCNQSLIEDNRVVENVSLLFDVLGRNVISSSNSSFLFKQYDDGSFEKIFIIF